MERRRTRQELNHSKIGILGVPSGVFWFIAIILLCGIIFGSFYDLQISDKLYNKTSIGKVFEDYGNVLSNFLFPFAGICLFKGLRKKGTKYNALSWVTLILVLFYTVTNLNDGFGKFLRKEYAYVAGESSIVPLILTYFEWVMLSALLMVIAYLVIDDSNPNLLFAIGAVIFAASITTEALNSWLKVVACRPRYRYLITLGEGYKAEFKNWWQMLPYLKDESNFRSWPSGHMTHATIAMCLPMFASVLKNRRESTKYVLLTVSIIWMLIMAYNRIHMGAHFMTDVCFGMLNSYIVYAIVYKAVFSSIKENNQ